MMKYIIRLFLGIIIFTLPTLGAEMSYAKENDKGLSIQLVDNIVTGTSKSFTFKTVQDDGIEVMKTLYSGCMFKKDLPEDIEKWTNNLITRKNNGNLYSLVIAYQNDTPCAALGLGRMPVVGYEPEKHTDIIQTYLDLGVIRLKNPQGGFGKENIEQVEGQGLGTLMPILPDALTLELKKEILETGIFIYKNLKTHGAKLPIENKDPSYVIGLCAYDNPLVSNGCFLVAGFKLLGKKGFNQYYPDHPKPDDNRILAFYKI